MPRVTPPRSIIDVVTVMGGGDGVGASGTGEEMWGWGRAEQNGRMKRDMNSHRATLSEPCIDGCGVGEIRGCDKRRTCADSGAPRGLR